MISSASRLFSLKFRSVPTVSLSCFLRTKDEKHRFERRLESETTEVVLWLESKRAIVRSVWLVPPQEFFMLPSPARQPSQDIMNNATVEVRHTSSRTHQIRRHSFPLQKLAVLRLHCVAASVPATD